jgi:hypothetical protein
MYAHIHTGDVVLLSSITPFAVVVKWGAASEFNHVAVAVRIDLDVLPRLKIRKSKGTLCLIEFNGDDVVNVLTNQIHHGNRLVLMSDVINKYKRVSIKKIHDYLYNSSFKAAVKTFIQKHCNTLVAIDMLTPAINAMFGFELKKAVIDEPPSFCSELAAKFYGDILKGSITTNYKNILPHQFASKKFNHIFKDRLIDIKNTPHTTMDFLHSPLFFIILALIVIIIFILFIIIGTKIYKRKYKKS